MDYAELLESLQLSGWAIVERTSKNHFRIIPNDKRKGIIHTSSTPSDYRSVKNLMSQLRRAGYRSPEK